MRKVGETRVKELRGKWYAQVAVDERRGDDPAWHCIAESDKLGLVYAGTYSAVKVNHNSLWAYQYEREEDARCAVDWWTDRQSQDRRARNLAEELMR